MAENKKVIVLGAGLSGLSAAWVLRKNGFDVCLLEKASYNGGLAVTKSHGEYRYDLGPHNIHTVHEHILTFLKRGFANTIFEHSPTSKIFKRAQMLDYPLKGLAIITSLPFWKVPLAAGSFFFARMRMFLRTPPQSKDHSFQHWITNRFGRLLYGEYFGPYAGKVWCIPGNQIDRYVAEKRVPIIGFVDLIRAALFGKPPRVGHPEFLDKNFYLRDGIGEIVDFFDKELRSLGAEIRNEVSVKSVHCKNSKIASVNFTDATEQEKTIACDYLLSTIPLPEFIKLIDDSSDEARTAVSQLDYCATILVFLKTDRKDIFPSKMLYFSDEKVKISRVYDVGSYSSAMVPSGKTLLCAEVPCGWGDSVWNAGDQEIAADVTRVFMAAGLLQAKDVDGTFVERISHSYPRFRVGFQDKLRMSFKYLDGISNCISYGRQGGFAYLNTDGVINLGMKAAEAVIFAESMGFTCNEWFKSRTT